MAERYVVEPAIGAFDVRYWALRDTATDYDAGWILIQEMAERIRDVEQAPDRAVVLITEWDDFVGLDWDQVAAAMAGISIGMKMRTSICGRRAPLVMAASSSAGSMLRKAAERIRNTEGTRASDSTNTIPPRE